MTRDASRELAFSSATEQAELVRRREVSPTELVELYLGRIEAIDGGLNSYVLVDAEGARRRAKEAERALDASDDLPAFHGVPISIKDLHLTRGVRTTLGSKAFAEFVPPVDEAPAASIFEAGFNMLGKTNSPEFGLFPWTENELHGPCRNPWDTSRTPGGSSGGAAAALAAGLCPISQASDGGGSARIPASCCGLVGLKPSRGRHSWGPLFGEVMAGFAVVGPISRTIADAAGFLDAIRGHRLGDPYWAPEPERPYVQEVGRHPGRLRIGLATDAPIGTADDECVAAATAAASLLEDLGHDVEPTDWPAPVHVTEMFTRVWIAHTAATPIPDWELTERKTRDIAERGRAVTSTEYVQAVGGLQAFSRQLAEHWRDFDVILAPTLAQLPLEIGRADGVNGLVAMAIAGAFTPFTPLVNVTGQPAISLPLHTSEDGLPVGVQLIGKAADEATLIRLSAQVEEARPWRDRLPALVVGG